MQVSDDANAADDTAGASAVVTAAATEASGTSDSERREMVSLFNE